MTEATQDSTVDPERALVDRLRKILGQVETIGKKTVEDLFDLGEAFEDAAGILHGRFTAWVSHECRIDPRTVLGYRRVHTVLRSSREKLIERRIAPSVLVRIAFAPKKTRERALALIEGGRDLKLADLKELSTRASRPEKAPTLRSALAEATRRLASELEGIAAAPGEGAAATPSAGRAAELAAALAVLMPDAPLLYVLRRLAGEDAGPAPTDESLKASKPDPTTREDTVLPFVEAPSIVPMTRTDKYARRFEQSAFAHGMTSLEICAGAGGQAYGLTRAGFRHVALVEHEPNACMTLRAAFPSANVIEADLKTVNLESFAGIDLLAGGPPCVSFSQAGKRAGASDSRNLMMRAVELVESLRPRAVMLENVKGIFERRHDNHRLDILSRLADAGYRCEWREVRAWEFGVPQARRRAILVGFRDEAAAARFAWPAPATGTDDEYYAMVSALDSFLRQDGYEPPEELLLSLVRLSPTLTGGSPLKSGADLGQKNSKKPWRKMGVNPDDVPFESPQANHVGPPKLTIAMAAALQGFQADWPFKGNRVERFKQIANAFPPIVALHLGCAIATALTGQPHDYMLEQRRLASFLRLRPWSDRLSGEVGRPEPRPTGRPAGAHSPIDVRALAARGTAALLAEGALRREEVYAPYDGDDIDEREAEHTVSHWEDLIAERLAELADPAESVSEPLAS